MSPTLSTSKLTRFKRNHLLIVGLPDFAGSKFQQRMISDWPSLDFFIGTGLKIRNRPSSAALKRELASSVASHRQQQTKPILVVRVCAGIVPRHQCLSWALYQAGSNRELGSRSREQSGLR